MSASSSSAPAAGAHSLHVTERFGVGPDAGGPRYRLQSARGVARTEWGPFLSQVGDFFPMHVQGSRVPTLQTIRAAMEKAPKGIPWRLPNNAARRRLLAVEIFRFNAMMGLHRRVHECGLRAWNPTTGADERVAAKSCVEMLPHAILHSLNDEAYAAASTRYLREPQTQRSYGSSYTFGGVVVGQDCVDWRGGRWVLCDRLVASKHVGARIQERETQTKSQPLQGRLLRTMNSYEGVVQLGGGEAPAAESLAIELADWRLVDDADCALLFVDPVLPLSQVELRGSNPAVFQRSLVLCDSDKRRALQLSAQITAMMDECREQIGDYVRSLGARAGENFEVVVTNLDGLAVDDALPSVGGDDDAPPAGKSFRPDGLGGVAPPNLTEDAIPTADRSIIAGEVVVVAIYEWREEEEVVVEGERAAVAGSDSRIASQRRKVHEQSITRAHYDKFRSLHTLHGEGGGEGDGGGEDTLWCFHWELAMMLLRYAALAGPQEADASQFHSSIHGEFALALCRELGVFAEGFATPFNTNTPFYCSLFSDTDRPFGSLGPFFNFRPMRGSFEVNPPFDTVVMTRLVRHLLDLLVCSDDESSGDESPGSPLSFIIVLPAGWDDGKVAAAVRQLLVAPCCVADTVVPQRDAVYLGGSQHRLERPYFRTRRDTQLVLLANAAARCAMAVRHRGGVSQGAEVDAAAAAGSAAMSRIVEAWKRAVKDVNEVVR